MEYQIALHPRLNISPADFVDAWNAHPDTGVGTTARVDPTGGQQYDMGLAEVGFAIVMGITTGMLGTLITNVLNGTVNTIGAPTPNVRTLIDPALADQFMIQEVPQSNGDHLVIIMPRES